MARVVLYGRLRVAAGVREVEVDVRGRRLIDVLRDVAKRLGIERELFEDGELKPYIIVIVDGREATSLGLLDEPLDDAREIRVVPLF